MIEAAIELTHGQIPGHLILQIIDLGRAMLSAEVQLLEGVRVAVEALAQDFQLMLITKGDLRDQESKLERSGLNPFFRYVEIVADKKPLTYQKLFSKYSISPERFLMIGNSLKSDILPVIESGGAAVHIPYPITWAHESVPDPPADLKGYYRLDRIDQLPDLIRRIVT